MSWIRIEASLAEKWYTHSSMIEYSPASQALNCPAYSPPFHCFFSFRSDLQWLQGQWEAALWGLEPTLQGEQWRHLSCSQKHNCSGQDPVRPCEDSSRGRHGRTHDWRGERHPGLLAGNLNAWCELQDSVTGGKWMLIMLVKNLSAVGISAMGDKKPTQKWKVTKKAMRIHWFM